MTIQQPPPEHVPDTPDEDPNRDETPDPEQRAPGADQTPVGAPRDEPDPEE